MNSPLEIATKAVQLYAESHPRPPHVTQRQAAKMLDLSAPTVSKLVKSGKLKLNGAGLIPIGQIDELLAARSATN
ncbi:MAG: helix-turn-helix domain-containing protein [Mizugakiibacter sp.]|uniref:helix-turn-helix domain-containing protein n=1 Tax=Mizugakiibacter sp. TaxID=1972610 RepID=UPI00321113C1